MINLILIYMKTRSILKSLAICIVIVNISSPAGSKIPSPSIKEESVTYVSNGVTMKDMVAYDSNIKGKRPAIIVIPEWWGLNDYTMKRARMLAGLGYVAMQQICSGTGKLQLILKRPRHLPCRFIRIRD